MQFSLELLTLEMGILSQPFRIPTRDLGLGSRRMVQKSLGESKNVQDNSGSLQYPTTAAKKKRQVDDDGIEAQRELNRIYTPIQ